jgi:hypothetical protein
MSYDEQALQQIEDATGERCFCMIEPSPYCPICTGAAFKHAVSQKEFERVSLALEVQKELFNEAHAKYWGYASWIKRVRAVVMEAP